MLKYNYDYFSIVKFKTIFLKIYEANYNQTSAFSCSPVINKTTQSSYKLDNFETSEFKWFENKYVAMDPLTSF